MISIKNLTGEELKIGANSSNLQTIEPFCFRNLQLSDGAILTIKHPKASLDVEGLSHKDQVSISFGYGIERVEGGLVATIIGNAPLANNDLE